MYPVSDAFLTAVSENTRTFKWSGKITTSSGVVYEFDENSIVKGSGYIARSCCGTGELELGTVYASEMGVSLFLDVDRYSLEGATVELYCGLKLADGTYETIPMGIYEVNEANRSIKTLELVCYDYMVRFEEGFDAGATSGYPYELLIYACEKCGVTLAHTQEEIEAMTNGTVMLGVYNSGSTTVDTFRDLIYYVAQVLACVCQINRFGELKLIPYGVESVVTINNTHRFSSSYSDFITRYTAISSTNEIEEIAEYYALEPDDALTMNLGINPLLQYGLSETREDVLTNILNAISVINYVPFKSETIGNPALDPMDVIRFTGGHADADAISCITSITYKIGGKQSLKGVGENPLLASAKSKNDKNISGLLNQVDSTKLMLYSYENASDLEIGDTAIQILEATFATTVASSAVFIATINGVVTANETEVERTVSVTHSVPTTTSIINRAVALAVEELSESSSSDVGSEEDSEDESNTETTEDAGTAIPEIEYEDVEETLTYTETVKTDPMVTILYKRNNVWITDFEPKQVVTSGKNIFTLFYPLGSLAENAGETLTVCILIEGGTLAIPAANFRAVIFGSSLATGYSEWDGRIAAEDVITKYEFAWDSLSLGALSGSVEITNYGVAREIAQDRISRYSFSDESFSLRGLHGETELYY